MNVIEINNVSEWDNYYFDWLKLHNSCQISHPFLNWIWVRSWADRLVLDHISPFLLVIQNENNEIVGLAPFQTTKISGLKCLEAFAQEFSDYVDWLYLPSYKDEVGKSIYHWLNNSRRKYDFLRIRNLLHDGFAYNTFKNICPESLQPHSIAPHINIEKSFNDYLTSLKPKFLSDTRRRKRKLEREIGKLEYVVISDPIDIPYIISIIARWLSVRRKEKKDRSYLDRKGMQTHLVRLYQTLFSQNQLHLSGFRLNNNFVALNVAFKYNNSLFSYTPVCDPALIKYSIIRILKLRHIEDCYKQHLYRYDFCLGGEEYKYNFNPNIKQLYSIILYNSNIKGFIRKMYDTRLKSMLRNAKIKI